VKRKKQLVLEGEMAVDYWEGSLLDAYYGLIDGDTEVDDIDGKLLWRTIGSRIEDHFPVGTKVRITVEVLE
jgi:hypothetical protein